MAAAAIPLVGGNNKKSVLRKQFTRSSVYTPGLLVTKGPADERKPSAWQAANKMTTRRRPLRFLAFLAFLVAGIGSAN